MKQATRLFVLLASISCPAIIFGYEQPTHVKLSEQAAKASVLYKPDEKVLVNLGLKTSIEDPSQVFPNSKSNPRRIIDLITDGADFEDNFPRPLHHFFDPLNDRPLTGGRKSPDWALEDKADFDEQVFSYKEARDYLYQALTLPTEDERQRHFGKTFQTLGQVIHHLQDMGQPQHVLLESSLSVERSA